jgi:hypothetical protein
MTNTTIQITGISPLGNRRIKEHGEFYTVKTVKDRELLLQSDKDYFQFWLAADNDVDHEVVGFWE